MNSPSSFPGRLWLDRTEKLIRAVDLAIATVVLCLAILLLVMSMWPVADDHGHPIFGFLGGLFLLLVGSGVLTTWDRMRRRAPDRWLSQFFPLLAIAILFLLFRT
jgi:hypothetical protein